MKYANQYLQSAHTILDAYDGSTPLAVFLKKYFSLHKKHGSRDRKNITHLCYAYCRLGHAGKKLLLEQRIRIALFLVNETAEGWAELFEQSWLEQWEKPLNVKLAFVKLQFPLFVIADLFPSIKNLSEAIDAEQFLLSHLVQPDLFLRIRPGQWKNVTQKLSEASIPFKAISNTTLSLPNSAKIDELLLLDKEAVIQDFSSQRMTEILSQVKVFTTNKFRFWDCCAGSCGKTILSKDTLGEMDITVSDIRTSILYNLATRFQKAGINKYESLTTDLSKPNCVLPSSMFDLILCDAPCSGSGTWGRTPEQLLFFTENDIKAFADLQKNIVTNILPLLVTGGYFLYITCSVFKQENEDIAAMIAAKNTGLELISLQHINGYAQKADSMFAVLFQKK